VSKKETRYHHGDLRSTLVEAAAAMIAEEGVAGVTMRGLAQRVGVSRTAPYRHFTDKAALLAAVAEEGFRRLAARIQVVWESHPRDATQGFLDVCVAYVEFARESPTHYRLMFGPEVSNYRDHPGLAATAKAAFDGMVLIVRQYLQENALDSSSPVRLAHAAWAMAHGLSMLVIDGRIRSCDDVEALVRFAFQALLKGSES
jgi:AcrR family transcriptional regulator